MERKIFEFHCHYLFKMSKQEMLDIFKEEFENTDVKKVCFLSIPQEYSSKGELKINKDQNELGLFLKKSFSPNAYAFAGLVHPKEYNNKEEIKKDFLKQVESYYEQGFDGMKMLEGYPTFIKYTGQGIDSEIYDEFYKFCEERRFPIVMHVANPDENWNILEADKYAIELGRVYDSTYPSKEEITNQVFNVLKKFPRLTLILAHFGFFSKHYEDAERFMSYQNTYLDTTPGGEQFIHISKELNKWMPFIKKYQDRIVYGSDFYAFIKDENFEISYKRRPIFLKQYFETSSAHTYLGEEFKGINLAKDILEKIYYSNAERLLGSPKKIK